MYEQCISILYGIHSQLDKQHSKLFSFLCVRMGSFLKVRLKEQMVIQMSMSHLGPHLRQPKVSACPICSLA